ncbi:MAG: S41 family peptidase [Gemmataceae bacterium]
MRSPLAICLVLLCCATAQANDSIRLANNPSLSPDGALLTFDWNGDVWLVPTAGGTARALTQHPARDREPKFSPDGREIAFVSDRDGSNQIYVMPVDGGTPQRVTYNTAGHNLEGWSPDGGKLLVTGARDNYWNGRQASRFFLIDRQTRGPEQMLFDDYGQGASLSPDGRRLLFAREGTQWWRKGYFGSQAAQIWMYDLDAKKFTKVSTFDRGCTNAMWKPDGNGCYVVSAKDGMFNLYEHDMATNSEKQLTHFVDDSIVQPCISADGKTIVFRHLFDFYRYQPGTGSPPQKIAIKMGADRPIDPVERRMLTQANDVSFSGDGLEVAFIAGGDVWVMDTELREPRQVTNSVEEERDVAMSPDGQFIYFISDMYGECNIWRAERSDRQKYWWQNKEFKLRRLTQTSTNKANLKISPDGSKVAFNCERGDLCVMDSDGRNQRNIVKSFAQVEFDWSPDSKWLVYAADDNDFNRDIWIAPLDGSRAPYNVSRSPFNDTEPTWSPDGKIIAYVGRNTGEENDIHYVYLRAEDDQTTSRERTLEKALEKMNRGRRPRVTEDGEIGEQAPPQQQPRSTTVGSGSSVPSTTPNVQIDFDQLHERVHIIAIPDTTENHLFWSPDGKRLAFSASVEGRNGVHAVDFPDGLTPKTLTSATGTHAHWLRNGQVAWLSGGVPASFAVTPNAAAAAAVAAAAGGGGRPGGGGRGPRAGAAPTAAPEAADAAGTSYRFQALQQFDRAQRNAAVFDLAWKTMRDNYYDERLGNHDWDTVRMKYLDMASASPDTESLSTVVNLMLGELNGSHLGFYPNDNLPASLRRGGAAAGEPATRWNETTAHLGVRFDPSHTGPGLRVRDIIAKGPADKQKTRIKPGEIITAIDDQDVNPMMDLTRVLNVPPGHEFTLKVKAADGAERTVNIQPISYPVARQLLYRQWVDDNAKMVEKLSGGKLGYLHIDAMAMPSFYKFQEELYSIGAGKDGLVIDVRENGGGSTADHLLTALSQPVHAVTVPRGGGPGYPQDRKVYASWNKPIVCLCNQNSFSNAEIFSHAIKTLKRGHLVGVPTAGGVISTGAAQIMDVGMLRLPFRGWFNVNDGRDMELNGAIPDVVVWPEPTQMANGKDVQLEKAVSVLASDVAQWQARPQPRLIKASETEPRGKADRPLVREAGGE